MKKLQFIIIMLVFSTSMSFAAFDQTISSTFELVVEIEHEESLLVTGGGAYQIDAWDFSYIEIQNTPPYQFNVGGINRLALNDYSSLKMTDGAINGIKIYSNATAIFEGGNVNNLHSYQEVENGPHITIFHSGDLPTVDAGNLLTGLWADGSAFSIQLVDVQGYSPVIDNIQFIPEPASLILLGLGGLLLRRRSHGIL